LINTNGDDNIMSKIYIDKISKHNLIHLLKNNIQNTKITIELYKICPKIHQIINSLKLPLELCGIINEYTDEYITCTISIINNKVYINNLHITVCYTNVILPMTCNKYHLSIDSDSCKHLINQNKKCNYADGVTFVNKFMEVYYNKKNYMPQDGYNFENHYCTYDNNSFNSYMFASLRIVREVTNKKTLKNIIVILKIIINIIVKYKKID
jgi:hypothetical protein